MTITSERFDIMTHHQNNKCETTAPSVSERATPAGACPESPRAFSKFILVVMMSLSLQNAHAQSQPLPGPRDARITFLGGATRSVTVKPSTVRLDTSAGRQSILTTDISAIVRSDMQNHMTLTLVTGERWVVAEDHVIDALFGEETVSVLASHQKPLESVRFTETPPAVRKNHFFKLLMKDGGIAIVDPASIILPVTLASGDAEIPLGTIKALRFAIRDSISTPESAFARFSSGNVHQLTWRAGRETLTALSVSGNKLRIRCADILGILPVASDDINVSGDESGASRLMFSLERKDGTVASMDLPLQVWSFETSIGSIVLPAPLLASFTVPQDRHEQGIIRTVYGETFHGSPAFKAVFINPDPDGQPEKVPVRDLVRVRCAQSPALPIPAHTAVFSLTDGATFAGTPYEWPLQLRTAEDEAISFQSHSSLMRTESDFFMLITSAGNAVLCKPEARTIDICMAVNGQRVRIAWQDIRQLNFRQRIIDAGMTDTTPAPGVTIDPGAPTRVPVSAPSQEPDPGSTIGRSFPRRSTSEDVASTIPLLMPWGKLESASGAVSRIHLQPESRPALVLTSAGDVILADMSTRASKRHLHPLLEGQPEQTNAPIVLPAAPKNADTITLRLIRGDILTGTLPEGDIPFRPLEKSDVRTGIPGATLQAIMRTGEDTLFYTTAHGTLTGNDNRDPLPIILALNSQPIEIPMHQIESLVRGNKSLPPSTSFTPGLPPAMANEIVLQGGTFKQGSNESGIPDESPCITVSLSPFVLDATEITRAQFASFVNAENYKTTAENANAQFTWMNPGFVQMPDDPVVCVSWVDAAEFCNWRSRQCELQPVYTFRKDGSVSTDRTASGYRLPTETEWEFAAGGSRNVVYPWGDSVTASAQDTRPPAANFTQKDGERDDGWRWTNPVQVFSPTPVGIYGMAGNVWEWCEDWYFARAYDTLKNRTPFNPCIQDTEVPGLTHRVMRGGSYRNDLDMMRVTSRGSGLPLAYAQHVGFRCARNAE